MTRARWLSAELPRVLTCLEGADHVLVALDYDGTLAPIVDDPNDAAIPPETDLVLSRIAKAGQYTLAIISGRSLSDLKNRVPVNALLAGNHGLEIEGRGISFVHERATLLSTTIVEACRDLSTVFRWAPGVVVECKHLSATVHFRQAPADLRAWIRATVKAVVRPVMDLLYLAPALESLEIRPRVRWNKGSAVRMLLGMMRAANPALICAGDDRTDEDMFGIVPAEISIRVGAATPTRARYHVRTPRELVRLLQALVDAPAKRLPGTHLQQLGMGRSVNTMYHGPPA
jgi:trehalose 6-phosphate phosphatase